MGETTTTEKNEELDSQTTQTIADEVLRYRIRKLIEEPKPASCWKRLLTNQLFLLIVAFVLTGVVGTYLAHYYNGKQSELEYQRSFHLKELESERSFANELNKTKLSKIAEVWEKVYLYEAAVEEAMQGVDIKSESAGEANVQIPSGRDPRTAKEQSKGLKKELLDLLSKNRLWLDDDNYYKIKEYAEVIYDYYFAKQTGLDLEKWTEKRDQARASVSLIRDKLLKR
jgi:hypothetical protein